MSDFSKSNYKFQPNTLNPEVGSTEGILNALKNAPGKLFNLAKASVLPEVARQLATTGIRTARTDTDDLRRYYNYGAPEEGLMGLVGDIGVRGRAALQDIASVLPGIETPLENAFGPTRAQQATPAAPTTAKATDAEKADAASLDDRVRNYMRTTGAGADGEGRRGSGTATPTNSATTAGSPNETGLKDALARQQTELADAKKRATALKPKDRSVFEAEEEARYKAAGIGKAAEAEQVRLDARQKGLEGENKAAFWNDLAKAGFKMASRAGAKGKDATNFFGALAAGGEDFSESNIKTASKFQALREDLAEKQSKFAVANEAVKMNRMDKADVLYRDAKRDFEAANKDVINFGTKMTGDQIEAHTKLIAAEEAHRKAVDLAKINNDARAREARIAAGDKNTVQRQLLQAYHNALKNEDKPAANEILENLRKVTAATTGFGAATKAASTENIAYKRNPFVMNYAATKPGSKEREEAAQRLRSQGLPLPEEMGGGGGSSNTINFADLK
jgi:hypothetical protein